MKIHDMKPKPDEQEEEWDDARYFFLASLLIAFSFGGLVACIMETLICH